MSFASGQITVINPSSTEVINDNQVLFLWSDNDSGDFEIELSLNPIFSPSFSVDTVLGVETLSKNNLNTGVYYWRIRNISIADTSWSIIRSFELIDLSSYSGLSFWLKPESDFQISSSNKISSWQNAASNNNALQTIAATQPSLLTNALNGFNVVSFDGADDNLNFNPEEDIREAFVVCIHNTGSQDYAPILGDGFQQPDFHGGVGNKLFINPFTSPQIRNGNVLVNGVSSSILSIKKPTAFTSFAVSTTDSTQASTIARDRGFTSRSWSGSYAELIFFNQTLSSSEISKIDSYLKWKFTPIPFLGKDQTVCGESIMLGVPSDNGYSSIVWSTGLSNVDSINVTQNGMYWVTVQSFGMTFSDTIVISGIIPKPIISLTSNQVLCFGDSVIVSYMPSPGLTGMWTNGDTSTTTVYSDYSQLIQLTHIDTNNCIASSDSFSLEIDSIALQSTLGPDRNACLGANIDVASSASGPFTYMWSTGDTTAFTSPQTTGIQDIILEMTTINNCIFRDTIRVNALNLQAPIVDFSSDTVCLFSNTNLFDQSISGGSDNIVFWKWDFGNEDSSFIENPQFSFSNYGSSVTLSVETDSACSNSITKSIYNHRIPNASFHDFIACAQDTFNLLSNSTVAAPDVISSYTWLVENQDYIGNNSAVSILNEGAQSIRLIIKTDKFCEDSITKTIEIFPALLPDFEAEQICIGDTTLFTDITPSFSTIDRTWIFDFFGQTSTNPNPNFYYPNPGTYDVKLSLTNAIGCQSEVIKSIEIRNLPEVDLVYDNTCEGAESALFDASSTDSGFITSQTWIIDGEELTGDSVYYTFENLGFNPVFLSVTDNFNCTDDTSILISVYPLPQADFDFSPNYGEAPIDIQFENLSSTNAVNFLWSFGDTSINAIDENPINTYNQNGVYEITLAASTLEGCTDSAIQTIAIIPTALDIKLSDFSLQKVDLGNGMTAYKPSVLMQNVGTRAIFNADLFLSINSETQIAETWEGVIPIGQSALYELGNFAVIENESVLDYVCLEAQHVNDNTELNFANNKTCLVQNGSLKTSELYPNPAEEIVHIDVITENDGESEIGVFDLLGKVIIPLKEVALIEGFNQISINTTNLLAGKYIVQLIYQEEIYSYSLIIHNR